jgi:very-short-patch-repair endonuclease
MSLEYNAALINKAKELRKNATPWENKLWYEFLRNYSVRFQRQKTIGNYIVDFYCHKAKLVIELDGGGHYEKEQIAYDEHRTAALERLGLIVLRFSNLDINRNYYGVCTMIDIAVKDVLPQSPAGDSSL